MKVLIADNDKQLIPLIDYLKSSGDFVFFMSENNYQVNEIDVCYFPKPNSELLKIALSNNIPIVADYLKAEQKSDKKKLYKSSYKYVNAIHYQSKEDEDDFEIIVGRRTNGHIFEDDVKKMRNMLLQYAPACNHNSNKKNYYSDELNDDFALNKIKVQKSSKPFKYIHKNPFWIFGGILAYFVIARPLIFILNKLTFHQHIKNRYVLKRCKHKGYFIYSNHTQGMTDAFTPNLLSFKRNYIVVSRETVSLPGLKGIVTMLGAIPIYSDMRELEPFNECIHKRIRQHKSVTIYPEAHIWPYYTKIRPFKKDSFRFPVDLDVPIYALTNTWQKRRFSKKPKLVSYLSGPLYPDVTLSRSEAMEDLRRRVYFEMIKVTRSVKQVEKIQYIQVKKD